jgi:hypothetical protein
MIVATQGRRVHLPEHALPGVLGQLFERLKPERRDSR